jgi:hypothetical protein
MRTATLQRGAKTIQTPLQKTVFGHQKASHLPPKGHEVHPCANLCSALVNNFLKK